MMQIDVNITIYESRYADISATARDTGHYAVAMVDERMEPATIAANSIHYAIKQLIDVAAVMPSVTHYAAFRIRGASVMTEDQQKSVTDVLAKTGRFHSVEFYYVDINKSFTEKLNQTGAA